MSPGRGLGQWEAPGSAAVGAAHACERHPPRHVWAPRLGASAPLWDKAASTRRTAGTSRDADARRLRGPAPRQVAASHRDGQDPRETAQDHGGRKQEHQGLPGVLATAGPQQALSQRGSGPYAVSHGGLAGGRDPPPAMLSAGASPPTSPGRGPGRSPAQLRTHAVPPQEVLETWGGGERGQRGPGPHARQGIAVGGGGGGGAECERTHTRVHGHMSLCTWGRPPRTLRAALVLHRLLSHTPRCTRVIS